MSRWNVAEVWEVVAESLPGATAQVQGARRFTWAELDQRADGVAHTLLGLGLGHQDKVAQYLANCPEYLESLFAVWKAGLVPVNTNYRYADEELVYLWHNADVVAVVFHGSFVPRIEGIRPRLAEIRGWLWVDDGSGPCPPWAVPYEDAAAGGKPGARAMPPWGRSPDDLFLLYTGGTTGMPKGVMWRQDDMFALLNATAPVHYPEDGTLDDVRSMLVGPGPVQVPAAPLMHGTGAFSSFAILSAGGCVVTLEGRHFSATELLDTIERERVKAIAIVGDAFAKPMLRELDGQPDRWDISSLRVITSSGVMWAESTKHGLLRHNPRLLLVDTFGSSEAVGLGSSVASANTVGATAAFRLGPHTRVITDEGRDVRPGSGEVGLVAMRGRMPVGYYKDPEKSASTFRVLSGQRYSVPGDHATVEADGTLRLLGRGSAVINTGGEKVYPEEVEEALKTHSSVHDAVAVGVPDERFGQAVCGLVELEPGAALDEAAVIAHVKAHLAGFKAPKRVLAVQTVGRAANGKVDYRRLTAATADRLAAAAAPAGPA